MYLIIPHPYGRGSKICLTREALFFFFFFFFLSEWIHGLAGRSGKRIPARGKTGSDKTQALALNFLKASDTHLVSATNHERLIQNNGFPIILRH